MARQMSADHSELPISVVMATFNGARFVAQQLDSVSAQTIRPSELVVGDDGSTDATLEIVERFAAQAPFPVVVIRNPRRLGAAENFLSLGMAARGPIVALSDWDDVWRPNKLERIAPWFRDPTVGMVVHRAEVVDEGLRPLGRRYPAISRTTVQQARRIDPWFSGTGLGVFRKSLLEAVAAAGDRPREASGHPMDHDDWIYYLSGSLGKTVLLAEDLVLYRQHGGSYMGAPGGDLSERVERGLRLGAEDFQRQAAMFRERREFWRRVASDHRAEAPVRSEAMRSAAWSGHLASLQDARATVRDEARGLRRRMLELIRLVISGGYRPRTRAGLGARAFGGDVLSLIRRSSAEPNVATNELANRVAAERGGGRSPRAIIAELSREGVAPLYGKRWTPEMIRDLVFQARRAAEADEAVPTALLPSTTSTRKP